MTSSSFAPASNHAGDSSDLHVRVTALLVATMWFEVLYGSAEAGRPLAPWLVALAGLAGELAFTVFEAAAAAAAWRLLGACPRWSALAPRLLVASSTETLAASIASG